MIIIKLPMNSKASGLLCNPCHFADALNAQFVSALIR